MSEAETSLPVAEEAAAPPPPTVGEQLAAVRQGRGLSIGDVAQALKLGSRQVEALENGNWQALPGPTFVRGFVRNYARLLGLDGAPLMAGLDAVLDKPATLALPPAPRGRELPQASSAARRDRLVVAAGGLLLLLAALAYFLLPGDLSALRESAQNLLNSLSRQEAPVEVAFPSEPRIVPSPVAEETVPEPDAAAPAEVPAATSASAPSTPATAATVLLRLTVSQESWVEVRDRADNLVFSQHMPAGSEQALGGPAPLSLVIGYAPGVRLSWRGKSVDLAPHTRGVVARLVLE
ncbi:MAG: helix-turn-helix domain-containing protein [Betaproteobacteria bacterium]|nr:helix-turn-helix domain-containing protein [Betaproteobacteria bacterium]MCL2887332.1 helix-turn-helix domain-containing protein [Betaproteobacteria bacterium]